MATAITREDIFKVVLKHVYEVLPDLQGRELQPSDSLRELGANSIDRADITMEIMEALSLSIPRVELLGPTSLGELVDLLQTKLQRPA